MPQMTAAVVGLRSRSKAEMGAAALMEIGGSVRLVRDPKNVFDSNAIEVWYLGAHIGFISRKCNLTLAQAMDQGQETTTLILTAPIIRGSFVDREPMIEISWRHPSQREGRDER